MLVATLIVICGHGVQGYPSGYDPTMPITHSVWAPKGTTFVQGVNALLNVVYTFIGHALIPSFVGDMERPQDFPKALAVSMAAEFALFTLTGAVVYHYTGTEVSYTHMTLTNVPVLIRDSAVRDGSCLRFPPRAIRQSRRRFRSPYDHQ